MAKFKVNGLDELRRDLERMHRNAQKMSGTHNVPLGELFTKAFMLKNTRFSSIDALLEAGGFRAETNEEFDAIPQKELDAHIAKVTKFKSWEELLAEAVNQYTASQLGF